MTPAERKRKYQVWIGVINVTQRFDIELIFTSLCFAKSGHNGTLGTLLVLKHLIFFWNILTKVYIQRSGNWKRCFEYLRNLQSLFQKRWGIIISAIDQGMWSAKHVKLQYKTSVSMFITCILTFYFYFGSGQVTWFLTVIRNCSIKSYLPSHCIFIDYLQNVHKIDTPPISSVFATQHFLLRFLILSSQLSSKYFLVFLKNYPFYFPQPWWSSLLLNVTVPYFHFQYKTHKHFYCQYCNITDTQKTEVHLSANTSK